MNWCANNKYYKDYSLYHFCGCRNMQMVQLDKHIKLLDSPGIVMASGNDASTILKNAVRVRHKS